MFFQHSCLIFFKCCFIVTEHNSQCSLFHYKISSLCPQCTCSYFRGRKVAVPSAQLILACLVTFHVVLCNRSYFDLVLVTIRIDGIKTGMQDIHNASRQGCRKIVLFWNGEINRGKQRKTQEGMLADNASRNQVCLPHRLKHPNGRTYKVVWEVLMCGAGERSCMFCLSDIRAAFSLYMFWGFEVISEAATPHTFFNQGEHNK